MGAHYRSLQIKGDNRDAIVAVLEGLTRKRKARLLVGPEINSWIGVYPNDDASSNAFVATIAKQLNGIVLDLMVHDSDVFYYNFYQGDKLVDEYASDPDYFEEVSPAEHEKLKGKPEVFRDLLGSDKKLTQLGALLAEPGHEGKFLFEENRLEKFAELLGIENTLTSYKYLTHGEGDGIRGRKQFIHVPDLTAEKAAARTAAAALRAEYKRLKKEGILCFESKPPKTYGLKFGEVAVDPLNGGILYKWGHYINDPPETKLFHIKPPWTSEPEMIEIPATSVFPNNFTFSRTGKWFAYSDGRLRLWDWPARKLIEGLDISSSPVQFSHDEKLLLCQNQNGFELFSMETKKVISTITAHNHFLAWHPSGRYFVNRAEQESLGLIDLEAGKPVKALYCGGINDGSDVSTAFSDALKKAGISEEKFRERIQGFVRGSEQPFSLKFSPDGKLLFCATTRGLRVLEWDKVLAAEKTTPTPLFETSPFPLEPLVPHTDKHYRNYIYDVVFDEKANRLLFCGTEGGVRFFNLNDSNTGILLRPPGKDYIYKLQLSPNREFICCHCLPPVKDRNKKSQSIMIWNYRLLRKAVDWDV